MKRYINDPRWGQIKNESQTKCDFTIMLTQQPAKHMKNSHYTYDVRLEAKYDRLTYRHMGSLRVGAGGVAGTCARVRGGRATGGFIRRSQRFDVVAGFFEVDGLGRESLKTKMARVRMTGLRCKAP